MIISSRPYYLNKIRVFRNHGAWSAIWWPTRGFHPKKMTRILIEMAETPMDAWIKAYGEVHARLKSMGFKPPIELNGRYFTKEAAREQALLREKQCKPTRKRGRVKASLPRLGSAS